MEVSALHSGSASGSLVRAAEQNPGVAVKLIKKAADADRNLVNTLLPTIPAGQVDIHA